MRRVHRNKRHFLKEVINPASASISPDQFAAVMKNVKEKVSADVLSLTAWSQFIHDVNLIDTTGSWGQKKELYDLIMGTTERKRKLKDLISHLAFTVFNKKDVQDLLKRIGIIAFQGAGMGAAWNLLSAAASGQANPVQVAHTALQGAVFGVVDTIVYQSREGILAKATSGITSQALLEGATNVLRRQPVISITGPLMAGVSRSISDAINQTVSQAGGWEEVLLHKYNGLVC